MQPKLAFHIQHLFLDWKPLPAVKTEAQHTYEANSRIKVNQQQFFDLSERLLTGKDRQNGQPRYWPLDRTKSYEQHENVPNRQASNR